MLFVKLQLFWGKTLMIQDSNISATQNQFMILTFLKIFCPLKRGEKNASYNNFKFRSSHVTNTGGQ